MPTTHIAQVPTKCIGKDGLPYIVNPGEPLPEMVTAQERADLVAAKAATAAGADAADKPDGKAAKAGKAAS